MQLSSVEVTRPAPAPARQRAPRRAQPNGAARGRSVGLTLNPAPKISGGAPLLTTPRDR